MANIFFTSWALIGVWKYCLWRFFDEKFDGIFDFVDFFTKFSFIFFGLVQ